MDTQEQIMQVMELRGQKLASLMERCRATGVWDGKVRNGFVTQEQRSKIAAQFTSAAPPAPDVLEQLFLQEQATGHLVRDFAQQATPT